MVFSPTNVSTKTSPPGLCPPCVLSCFSCQPQGQNGNATILKVRSLCIVLLHAFVPCWTLESDFYMSVRSDDFLENNEIL